MQHVLWSGAASNFTAVSRAGVRPQLCCCAHAIASCLLVICECQVECCVQRFGQARLNCSTLQNGCQWCTEQCTVSTPFLLCRCHYGQSALNHSRIVIGRNVAHAVSTVPTRQWGVYLPLCGADSWVLAKSCTAGVAEVLAVIGAGAGTGRPAAKLSTVATCPAY
jgi:hypothetical protein